jgi:hypothetical protein
MKKIFKSLYNFFLKERIKYWKEDFNRAKTVFVEVKDDIKVSSSRKINLYKTLFSRKDLIYILIGFIVSFSLIFIENFFFIGMLVLIIISFLFFYSKDRNINVSSIKCLKILVGMYIFRFVYIFFNIIRDSTGAI